MAVIACKFTKELDSAITESYIESPRCSIASIAFSDIPDDFEICEDRFKEDAEYRKAVTYMFKVSEAGEIDEEEYKKDAEYRAAIAVVLSPGVVFQSKLVLIK